MMMTWMSMGRIKMKQDEFITKVLEGVAKARPVYSKEELKIEFEKERDWVLGFYDNVEDGYGGEYEKAVRYAILNFSMLI